MCLSTQNRNQITQNKVREREKKMVLTKSQKPYHLLKVNRLWAIRYYSHLLLLLLRFRMITTRLSLKQFVCLFVTTTAAAITHSNNSSIISVLSFFSLGVCACQSVRLCVSGQTCVHCGCMCAFIVCKSLSFSFRPF